MRAWRIWEAIEQYVVVIAICVGIAFAICILDDWGRDVRSKFNAPETFRRL